MEQWEKNYYISSIAGSNNGSSLVVMSKGWFALSHKFCVLLHNLCQFLGHNLTVRNDLAMVVAFETEPCYGQGVAGVQLLAKFPVGN